jgi:hypothetical protein
MRSTVGTFTTLEPNTSDEVLAALDAVIDGLGHNAARIAQALTRAGEIREQRSRGLKYTHIVEHAQGPLLVELLTENLLVLHNLGHRLRSAEVRALHGEGLSTTRIAELFGVSRQRVSVLLNSTQSIDEDGPAEDLP